MLYMKQTECLLLKWEGVPYKANVILYLLATFPKAALIFAFSDC